MVPARVQNSLCIASDMPLKIVFVNVKTTQKRKFCKEKRNEAQRISTKRSKIPSTTAEVDWRDVSQLFHTLLPEKARGAQITLVLLHHPGLRVYSGSGGVAREDGIV